MMWHHIGEFLNCAAVSPGQAYLFAVLAGASACGASSRLVAALSLLVYLNLLWQ